MGEKSTSEIEEWDFPFLVGFKSPPNTVAPWLCHRLEWHIYSGARKYSEKGIAFCTQVYAGEYHWVIGSYFGQSPGFYRGFVPRDPGTFEYEAIPKKDMTEKDARRRAWEITYTLATSFGKTEESSKLKTRLVAKLNNKYGKNEWETPAVIRRSKRINEWIEKAENNGTTTSKIFKDGDPWWGDETFWDDEENGYSGDR